MAAPFKLDDNLLHELGLGTLPVDEKNRMLAHIYETLEMRVGMRLAEQMSDEQLDEFESYINRNDEAGALKWLESNFPNYKDVVAEELEKLKNEIRAVAPQIVAQSQMAATQAQAPTPNPNMAPPMPQGAPGQVPGYQTVPQPAPQMPVQPQPYQQPQAQPQPYQPSQQPQPGQYQQPPQYPSPAPMPSPQPQSQPQYPQQPYSPPVPPMPSAPQNDPGTYQPPQQSA